MLLLVNLTDRWYGFELTY